MKIDWEMLEVPRQESKGALWPELMEPEEVEMAFYEKFFFSKDMEPYPVQEEAFNRIFAGEHLMIMVPTGTGKTMMAKAGLMKALYTGQRAIYTTPLRALTEEKYRELCDDFGARFVGFATGDYKINPNAPIQVMVAEILWNMIYGGRRRTPADIVIMDEGHYFNDFERGYVWEQSIIGLREDCQLVVLSATVGNPQQFCQWAYLARGAKMELVESHERRVPLFHQYEEKYLLEVVRELFDQGDYPAIIFSFGRKQCFEWARLLKSIRRFTTDEEQKRIAELADQVIVPRGIGNTLRSLLTHGIGIHHAGILPAYKQLIEELTLERLIKFVVSTETISAGINLPAKRVVFPALRKHVRRQARLLMPAEYHQMAGRAGRPQFDTEGIAITLAPEKVVQEFRKELKDAEKSRRKFNPEDLKRRAYSRARTEAQQNGDVSWDQEAHQQLVEGKPAALRSHTKITAEQILAIGLPDLTEETLPGAELVEAEKRAQEAREAEKARLLQEATGNHDEAAAAKTKKAKKKKAEASPAKGSFAQQLLALQVVKEATEEAKEAEAADVEEAKAESQPETETTEVTETTEATEAQEATPTPETSEATDAAKASETPEASATPEATGAEEAIDKDRPWQSQGPLPPPLVSRPGSLKKPPTELDIRTIIDKLLLDENDKREYHKQLVKITNNLKAFGVINENGIQVRGWMVGHLRGIDGLFVYYCLMNYDLNYDQIVELVEYLVDHNVIQNVLDRKKNEKKREWIRTRLRERRYEGDNVSWDDVEAEYDRKFPYPLTNIEKIHQQFISYLPHPELHGGKRPKEVWRILEQQRHSFMDFVERHHLEEEEGSLFSYLSRVMKTAKMLFEVTGVPEFFRLEMNVRSRMAVIDDRIIDNLWGTMKDRSLAPPLETLPPHPATLPEESEDTESLEASDDTEESDGVDADIKKAEDAEKAKEAEALEDEEDAEEAENSESIFS